MSLPFEKVVVTGLGGICSLGNTGQAIFDRALLGSSEFKHPHDEGSLKWFPSMLCAPVDDDFKSQLLPAEVSLDRAVQLAYIACAEALSDASLTDHLPAPSRTGVFCGIGLGGHSTSETLYTKFFQTIADNPNRNPTIVHPLSVPRLMPNATAAAISMKYGLTGTTNTYSIACASSAAALGEAYRHIKHGYADCIVVVGAEAMLTLGSYVVWNALRVLAKPRADDIAASCRPFSSSRTGFVLGEGAACIVLESLSSARKRKAKMYAELAGYGTSSDAQHITAPSTTGQVRAMQSALDEAGLTPNDIQYINAHGTATDIGDVTEAESIRLTFGAHAQQVHVSSTKSMHGHLIGAAGTLEMMIAIHAMNTGSIPPTAYLVDPDPKCALNHVASHAKHGVPITAVMSNSFAFGGSNVSLVAKSITASL